MSAESMNSDKYNGTPVPIPILIGRFCCHPDESHELHDHWNEYRVGEEIVIRREGSDHIWVTTPEKPLSTKSKS